MIRSWANAINDFTDLLRVDPLNASARVLRGRAYAAQGQWSPAVEDLSAAIHLDPNHWQAFYHRACILRKSVDFEFLSVTILVFFVLKPFIVVVYLLFYTWFEENNKILVSVQNYETMPVIF